MTLGRYIRRVLVQDPGVSALAAGRVYSHVLPQGPTMPAVVFTVIGGTVDSTLVSTSGPRQVRVQVDAWADTQATSRELADAVRAAVAGHKGAAGGLVVQSIEIEFADLERYDEETELYATTHDLEVWVS